MDKKTIIIIILFVIVISLVFVIFSGKNNLDSIINSLRIEQSELTRSNEIIKSELDKSEGYNKELETDNIELSNDNTELEQIINRLTAGSEKTGYYISEYGNINKDFAEFIRQATITD